MVLSREMRVMEDQVSRRCRRSLSLLLVAAEKLIIRTNLWGGANLLFSSSYETLYIRIRDKEIEVAQSMMMSVEQDIK